MEYIRVKVSNSEQYVYAPKATTENPGIVQPDGTTIVIEDGRIVANFDGLVKKSELNEFVKTSYLKDTYYSKNAIDIKLSELNNKYYDKTTIDNTLLTYAKKTDINQFATTNFVITELNWLQQYINAKINDILTLENSNEILESFAEVANALKNINSGGTGTIPEDFITQVNTNKTDIANIKTNIETINETINDLDASHSEFMQNIDKNKQDIINLQDKQPTFVRLI